MSKHDSEWVAFDTATQKYLSHPRSEWTSDVEQAHGWHYKKECLEGIKYMGHAIDIGRRSDFRKA